MKRDVYNELVKSGFLTAEPAHNMNENERFHGLSAWKLEDQRKLQESCPGSEDADCYYTKSFDRFKKCLQNFSEACLGARIEEICSTLIAILSRCLDVFIREANVRLKDSNSMKRILMKVKEQMRASCEKIVQSLGELKEEVKTITAESIEGAAKRIVEKAGKFSYSTREVSIPLLGVVSDSVVIDNLRFQIQTMVVADLESEIQTQILMMFGSQDELTLKIKKSIIEIEMAIKEEKSTPATAVLAQNMIASFEWMDVLNKNKNVFGKKYLASSIKSQWKHFLHDAQAKLEKIKGNVFVTSPTWKQQEAKSLLNLIDPSKMADELIEDLKSYFVKCHNDFMAELGHISELFQLGSTVQEQQRVKIVKLAPKVALLEIEVFDVIARIRFGQPKIGQLISQGGQGGVYECLDILSANGRPCVVKVIFVSNEDDTAMENLALEVHNTRYDIQCQS